MQLVSCSLKFYCAVNCRSPTVWLLATNSMALIPGGAEYLQLPFISMAAKCSALCRIRTDEQTLIQIFSFLQERLESSWMISCPHSLLRCRLHSTCHRHFLHWYQSHYTRSVQRNPFKKMVRIKIKLSRKIQYTNKAVMADQRNWFPNKLFCRGGKIPPLLQKHRLHSSFFNVPLSSLYLLSDINCTPHIRNVH